MGLRLIYAPAVTVRHLRGTTSGGGASPQVQYLSERTACSPCLRNAPLALALGETWRKRRGGGDDGVAEVIARGAVRALSQRAILRADGRTRRGTLRPLGRSGRSPRTGLTPQQRAVSLGK